MYRKYIHKDGLIVKLPVAIFEEIKYQVNKHYPLECGGVFVGKIDSNIATIEEMKMPKRFKSSPVLFVRIAPYLNTWLKQIFKKSEGTNIYLGEWHSHPNGRPIPSGTDFSTIKKIAESHKTRIQTPLLLIIGYDGSSYYECLYIFSNNKLLSYTLEY